MNLLLVESPGKTKKIEGFLGSGWKVMASVGHVRDLPDKEMGVAAPDFKPHYVPTVRGKDVLSRLASAVRDAETVYLATDPDREGEAIAWHLADALKLNDAKRVTFSEITEKAVKAALDAPRSIDMGLVQAQEGRRVLDRFCGYMVSGPLCRAAGARLSAGRVQSPALRLVVERERDIRNFKVTAHFGVELLFEAVENVSNGWRASWVTTPWLEEGQEYFLDRATAEKVAGIRSLEALDFKESESRTAPPAPFTTSSLQQAASNALKFNPKRTMELAQKLYESGSITYMRTDSPNLSEDFVSEARIFCEEKGWPVVTTPRTWKSKAGAQEAHEAVRPTHIEVEEAGADDAQKALYRLIRLRTLAAMLEDAVFSVRVATLAGDVDGRRAEFEAKGRTLVSPGWKVLTLTDQTDDPDAEQEADNPVPSLQSGQKITVMTGKVQSKKTKPPARFTEASLVKELEKRGIGRPSTYATILDNISSREYVKSEKRFLVPTPLGETALDHLVGKFSFLDFDFTKKMESTLDDIAEGKASYRETVSAEYDRLSGEVKAFSVAMLPSCPECGSDKLWRRVKKPDKKDDRSWDFFSCSDCEATFDTVDGKPGPKREKKEKPPVTEYKCPKCGKPLYHRTGTSAKTGNAYDFYACSGFPKCKASFNTKEDGKPDLENGK